MRTKISITNKAQDLRAFLKVWGDSSGQYWSSLKWTRGNNNFYIFLRAVSIWISNSNYCPFIPSFMGTMGAAFMVITSLLLSLLSLLHVTAQLNGMYVLLNRVDLLSLKPCYGLTNPTSAGPEFWFFPRNFFDFCSQFCSDIWSVIFVKILQCQWLRLSATLPGSSFLHWCFRCAINMPTSLTKSLVRRELTFRR